MGAGAGGYVTIRLQTDWSQYDFRKDELSRTSELLFEAAEAPDRARPKLPADAGPPPPKPPKLPAGKVGLGGLRPKDVRSFNLYGGTVPGDLVGMGTAPDDIITDELVEAFGGTWAGFAVALAPSGARFNLVADIVLKPKWKKGVVRPFQVVPVVMAFGTDRFVDHYLLALIVAQPTNAQVDTSVTQPY